MDHYAVLGVPKDATPDQIKKAYRKLASQHHPDKGGDKAKFQEVQTAYDVLSDPEKKAQYDNPMPPGFQGFPGQGFNVNINGGNFEDIFAQFFGQQNFHRPQKQVFRTNVTLTLEQAYLGGNQILRLNTMQGSKVIDLTVPRGVNQGDSMRYENVIENGVLLVEFNIIPDLRFDRKGKDLYSNQSISVLDLIVGNTFEFTTISGTRVEVHVRPKTQPYMQLKLAGHGMPIPNTNMFGDQLILLKPYIPDNIDQEIVDSILRSRTK